MMDIPCLDAIKCSCDQDDFVVDRYECLICNSSLEFECECYFDPDIDEQLVYCQICTSVMTVKCDDLCPFQLDDDQQQLYETEWATVIGCIHANNPITFLDGTTVYASSEHERKESDESPDFAIYADELWKPSCLAYLVAWEDYGLPVYWDKAAYAIIDSYKKAKDGLWVEVGCLGGHGRTGTILACMAVLSGMAPTRAIEFVRDAYCHKAIEVKEQEWWVRWFSKFVNGGTIKKPKHYLRDPLAGQIWTFTGKLKVDEFDPFAVATGKPSTKPVIETYERKVKVQ